MEFLYRARDKKGNLQLGSIDARNADEVVATLREHKLIATNIKRKSDTFNLQNIENRFSPIKEKHKVIFTRELATMINAGLPIVEALQSLANQQQNKRFGQIIMAVSHDIEGGTQLAESLNQYPNLFSDVFVNLIKAGEESGKLDVILIRIAEHMEKDYSIQTKTKSAMIYPGFILATLFLVIGLMMFYLIPKVRTILEGAGGKLPLLTKALFTGSDFAIKYWYIIIPLIVISYSGFRYYVTTTRHGQLFWAGFIVKVPVFGLLMQKTYMARFSRTASTLLSSGLSVVDVLELTAKTIGNIKYERGLLKTLDQVKNGKNISESLRSVNLFPETLVQMISVGEKTGALDEVTGKMADFYEEEVDQLVNNFSKLLEPFLIVALGIGVGIVAYAIIVPIYDMTGAIGKQ